MDSNFIYLNPWCEFIDKHILNEGKSYTRIRRREKSFGRYNIEARQDHLKYDSKYKENEMFKRVNIMANILTDVIALALYRFVSDSNIEDDAPGLDWLHILISIYATLFNCWKLLINYIINNNQQRILLIVQ